MIHKIIPLFIIFIIYYSSSVNSHYHQDIEKIDNTKNTNIITNINATDDSSNDNPNINKIFDTTTAATTTLNESLIKNIVDRQNYFIMNARRISYHTLMNTIIYTITLLPLLFTLARTFNNWPNGFIYAKRFKRSININNNNYDNNNNINMNPFSTFSILNKQNNNQIPLLNHEDTKKFLSLLETTLQNKKIFDGNCRKYYSCKVIQNAIKLDSKYPKLSNYEWSLLNLLGIVAERFDYKLNIINSIKMYYEIVANSIKGATCSQLYNCHDNNQTTAIAKQQQMHGQTLQKQFKQFHNR